MVMAGLLPELQKSQPIPEIKHWLFLEPVSPGERPIDSLVYALNLPFLNKQEAGSSLLATHRRMMLRQEVEDFLRVVCLPCYKALLPILMIVWCL